MDFHRTGERNPRRDQDLAVNHIRLNNFRTFINISTSSNILQQCELRFDTSTEPTQGFSCFVDKFRNKFPINDL